MEVRKMKTLDTIIKARAKLMKGHIGMASMLLNLDLVECEKSKCDTMATDGKNIFYYPPFVDKLTEAELRGVLVHEALHVVYEHPLRRGKRHPKVWNIACDYVINAYLYWDLNFELPFGGLLDHKYKGWSAEKVYQHLIKNEDDLQEAIEQVKEQNQNADMEDDSQDSEIPDTSEGNISDEETDEDGEAEGGESESIDLDAIPSTIGEVLDATDDEGKPLSDAEIQEISTEIQRAVALSDKLEVAVGSGTNSSCGGRMEELKETSIDWKEQLNDLLRSSVANDYSWSRLNKRFAWQGINLPSKTKSPQGGELAVAIDTSGSVSQYELNKFATEIQAMAEDCGLEKIRVCYCDTTVRKNGQGEWWDYYDLSSGDELELVVRGGGGTEFDPVFNLLNDYTDDAEDVQALVYFTDGWGDVSEDVEPDVPVFWCCTEKSSYSERLAFGEVVYVDTARFYD